MMKNKKGLSEIVSYVLLVLIAVALSIAVYAWLQLQVPKEKEQCPADVSLIIADYKIDNANKLLNLTIQNKGFHDVDGFNIKISNETGRLPTKEMELISPKLVGMGTGIFADVPFNSSPGQSALFIFNFSKHGKIAEIEMVPYRLRENKFIFCDAATIRQKLETTA